MKAGAAEMPRLLVDLIKFDFRCFPIEATGKADALSRTFAPYEAISVDVTARKK